MALHDDLERWRAAGLIREDQVAAIAEHERVQGTGDRRSSLVEAIGYVGAALAVGAVGLLTADAWSRFTLGGQLALVALLTVVAGGAGVVAARGEATATRRLGGVLLAAAGVSAGWFAGIVAADVADLDQAGILLAVGIAGAVVTLPALLLRPGIALQLVGLASIVTVAVGALSLPQLTPDRAWFSLLAWSVAVAWALLGRGGAIRPTGVAIALGGAGALIALQAGTFDAPVALLSLGILTGAGLVALAIVDGRTLALVVGSLGLLVMVPQLAFELFGDAIGAPATLLVIGLLLVLLAIGLGRARHELGGPGTTSPPSGGPSPSGADETAPGSDEVAGADDRGLPHRSEGTRR